MIERRAAMVKPEIRDRLSDDALVFDNPSYDNSIIGQTFDGRAIYNIELMAEELSSDEGMSIEEACAIVGISVSEMN